MEAESLEQKEKIVSRMLTRFKPERILYLSGTLLSFLALLCLVIYNIICVDNKVAVYVALFAPTGVIAFCCGQFLRMWGDSLNFVSKNTDK